MNRRIVLHSCLLVVMAILVGGIFLYRERRPELSSSPSKVTPSLKTQAATPERKPEEPILVRPKPDSNPEKLPTALHDSTLKGLIQNAKVAQLRGDTKTRDAMVKGLKSQQERSKELLKEEIASSRDRDSASALQTLMEALQ